jgi:tetratricopeptide (TPR) repeat protein
MKKLLIAIFFVVSMVAQNIDMQVYNTAKKNYDDGNYTLAYEQFNGLFFKHLDSIKINYYLAQSAVKLKKYDTAIGAYERILIQKPKSAKIRLALANIYMKLGIWPQALSELNKALKYKLPKALQIKIEDTIEILRNREKEALHSFYALVGMMYDSNINNTSNINSFSIYSPDFNTSLDINQNTKEQGATIVQLLGVYNNKYKIKENIVLDSTLNVYQQQYLNHKNKDIQLISLNIKPTYFSKAYTVSLALGYDKFYLGHEQYQDNFFITPQIMFALNQRTFLATALQYGNVNYQQNRLRDYGSYTFQNKLKYISDIFGLLQWDMDIGKDNETNEQRTDVDKWYYDTKVSNSFPLLNAYKLNSALSYKMTKYTDKDVNFLSKREDKKYQVSFGVQKELNKTMTLTVGADYIKNDSNHEPFSYDKYVLKTNLFVKF